MKSYILPTVVLFLLLYFLSTAALWAQTPPKFRRLTTADGLPSNSINTIFEDKAGFLWIGTDAGLARYDGKNMQIFQHQHGNKNSIADNTIYKITQDGKGNIWILTDTKLNQYDPVLQQWKQYPRPDPNKMIELAILFADRDGNIWWLKRNEGYKDGASIVYQSYRVKTGEIKDYVCRFSLPKQDTSKVQSVYPNLLEYKGELYAAGGFMKYDKARDAFVQTYAGEGLPYPLRTFAMTHDEKGNVYYFGSEFGQNIWQYNLDTRRLTLITNRPMFSGINFPDLHYMQTGATTYDALYDNSNRKIWLATFGMLVEIDINKQQHFQHLPNRFDNFAIANRVVKSLHYDTKGNIWVGTANGVSYFPSRPQFFHEYPRLVDKKVSLSGSNVKTFTEDEQKRIWVGTQTNISFWNRVSGNYDTLLLPNPQEPVYTKGAYGGKADVQTLISIGTSIYAGTWGAGLYKINPQTKKAEYLSPALLNEDKEDKLEIEKRLTQSLPFISQAKADEDGNLWAIDWGIGLDLLCYNPHMQTFRRYPIDKTKNCFSDTSGVIGGQLMSLAISPDKIYVGSEISGLHEFNRKKLCFERRYSYDAANPKSISSNKVITVFVSKAGEVWAGTENGLNRLKKDGTFERFQNFPNNYIAAIEEDDKGFLWIATQNGLCRFNPRNGKFIFYNEHNGLQSGGFNQNAIFKSSSGEIFVGGANGFNYFHPDSVIARQKQTAPRVVLTHLKVMNKYYVSQDTALEFRKAISLAHDENDLQFTFAALDLSAPANNSYQYRLILKNDGWFNLFSRPDTAWINMGNNSMLNLPRVSFGDYVLEVRASAAPDIWSSGEDIARLYLSISAPWYLTKTFWAILLLSIGIGLYTGYKIRQRVLEQQNKLLEQIVAERTRELNQANSRLMLQAEELRQKNEEISAQAEELKLQNEVIEKQRQELERLQVSQSHDTKNNYDRLVELIKEEIKHQTDPKAIESLEKIVTVASIRAHLSRRIYEEQRKDATYRYDLPTYINEIIYELSSIAAGSNFDELKWTTSVENFKLMAKELNYLERILSELYHNAEKYLRNLPYAPHIHITIKQINNGWMFTYQDNGSGYPEAVLQKGASALADLYRTCGDLRGEMRIANNNGAYFELIVDRSTDNKQKRQQTKQA